MQPTAPSAENLPPPLVETFTPTNAPTSPTPIPTPTPRPYMQWQVIDGKLVCQWLQAPD